jgi:hypothetical protein
MYDGSVGIARFPDFSVTTKFEIPVRNLFRPLAFYCFARRAAELLELLVVREVLDAPFAGQKTLLLQPELYRYQQPSRRRTRT